MSVLKIEELIIPSTDNGEIDSVPPVERVLNLQQPNGSRMDEDDELFLGYGFEAGCFPYRSISHYTRELKPKAFKSVILENDKLKAVFLPEAGGRLWQLYDKVNKRDLLFVNPVYRFGNLSTRNAWFSGGVEFNFGTIGHHPHTCERINSSQGVMSDGTPYFRMYEFERIRAVTYQIDCFLPEASPFLYVRCRIMNDTNRVIPAYWWSNIAVPAYEGGRVIVPADSAFCQAGGGVNKRTVPFYEGKDVTYPESSASSFDYFWNIPQESRKYIAHLDKNGYGLMQCSTRRLKGRKLFVWGQSAGGRRWQAFLSDGTAKGSYHEIQAGLGKTQYECVPMPPFTAWEWLEAYGAMQLPVQKAHGEWDEARHSALEYINATVLESEMDTLLAKTKETMAKCPAEKMITYGSGWGALENARRKLCGEAKAAPHLDFGELLQEQQYWYDFMVTGEFPESNALVSYMRQPEWTKLLELSAAASGKWKPDVNAQLGLIYISDGRLDEAREYLEHSLSLKKSPEAMFGLSMLASLSGDADACADYALEASRLCKDTHAEPHYIAMAIERLHRAARYSTVLRLLDSSPKLWDTPRNKLYGIFACVKLQMLSRAEELLYHDGGFELPDLREGETIITSLWEMLQEEKSKATGATNKTAEKQTPPAFFDFRMQA